MDMDKELLLQHSEGTNPLKTGQSSRRDTIVTVQTQEDVQENDSQDKSSKRKYDEFGFPQDTHLKIYALVLLCICMFTEFIAVDNPQALQEKLQKRLNINDFQFNILYFVYGFPNVILGVYQGMLTDKLGKAQTCVYYQIIELLGLVLIYIGVWKYSFMLVVLGRFLLGVGVSGIYVNCLTGLQDWFKNFATVSTILISTGRLTMSIQSSLIPYVSEKTDSVLWPLVVPIGVCTFALICAILYCNLSYTYEQKKMEQLKRELVRQDTMDASSVNKSGLIYFLKQLSITAWSVLLLTILAYGHVTAFNAIMNKYLTQRFGYSVVNAGNITSIPTFLCALFCPVVGYTIDKKGYRCVWLILSFTLATLSQIILAFSPQYEECSSTQCVGLSISGIVLYGMHYFTFYPAIWGSIPLVTEERYKGKIVGLGVALMSGAVGFFPLISGFIHDKYEHDLKHGYYQVSLYLLTSSVLGLIVAVFLKYKDVQNGGILSRPSVKKEVKQQFDQLSEIDRKTSFDF